MTEKDRRRCFQPSMGGKALGGGVTREVLGEFERLVAEFSPQLADSCH